MHLRTQLPLQQCPTYTWPCLALKKFKLNQFLLGVHIFNTSARCHSCTHTHIHTHTYTHTNLPRDVGWVVEDLLGLLGRLDDDQRRCSSVVLERVTQPHGQVLQLHTTTIIARAFLAARAMSPEARTHMYIACNTLTRIHTHTKLPSTTTNK